MDQVSGFYEQYNWMKIAYGKIHAAPVKLVKLIQGL